MTVADLTPLQLFGFIIAGTMVGFYAPILFNKILQESWSVWPIQTKIYICVVGTAFMGMVFGPVVYLIRQ